MEELEMLLLECEDKMDKAIEALKRELSTVRTGRANSSLLDSITLILFVTSFVASWTLLFLFLMYKRIKTVKLIKNNNHILSNNDTPVITPQMMTASWAFSFIQLLLRINSPHK